MEKEIIGKPIDRELSTLILAAFERFCEVKLEQFDLNIDTDLEDFEMLVEGAAQFMLTCYCDSSLVTMRDADKAQKIADQTIEKLKAAKED